MSHSSNPSNKRRSFKAEVVLSLLTGAKTQAELCRQHELSPNLLSQWKDTFLRNAVAKFKTREQNSADTIPIADLERAEGRATLENDA
ncbi:MAG: transposase [Armatimonadota bacterium]